MASSSRRGEDPKAAKPSPRPSATLAIPTKEGAGGSSLLPRSHHTPAEPLRAARVFAAPEAGRKPTLCLASPAHLTARFVRRWTNAGNIRGAPWPRTRLCGAVRHGFLPQRLFSAWRRHPQHSRPCASPRSRPGSRHRPAMGDDSANSSGCSHWSVRRRDGRAIRGAAIATSMPMVTMQRCAASACRASTRGIGNSSERWRSAVSPVGQARASPYSSPSTSRMAWPAGAAQAPHGGFVDIFAPFCDGGSVGHDKARADRLPQHDRRTRQKARCRARRRGQGWRAPCAPRASGEDLLAADATCSPRRRTSPQPPAERISSTAATTRVGPHRGAALSADDLRRIGWRQCRAAGRAHRHGLAAEAGGGSADRLHPCADAGSHPGAQDDTAGGTGALRGTRRHAGGGDGARNVLMPTARGSGRCRGREGAYRRPENSAAGMMEIGGRRELLPPNPPQPSLGFGMGCRGRGSGPRRSAARQSKGVGRGHECRGGALTPPAASRSSRRCRGPSPSPAPRPSARAVPR